MAHVLAFVMVFIVSGNALDDVVHVNSFAHVIKQMDGFVATEQLLEEAPVVQASLEFAFENGGNITRRVLDEIRTLLEIQNTANYTFVVDTRVMYLGVGDAPSPPEWHTDFVPRIQGDSCQHDYLQPDIGHGLFAILLTLSDRAQGDGVSNTIFAHFVEDIPVPAHGQFDEEVVAEYVTQTLNFSVSAPYEAFAPLKQAGKGHPGLFKASDGDFVLMDQFCVHSTAPAHNEGIRFFMRIAVSDSVEDQKNASPLKPIPVPNPSPLKPIPIPNPSPLKPIPIPSKTAFKLVPDFYLQSVSL